MALMDVVSPVVEPPPKTNNVPRLDSLKGKVLGLDDSEKWFNFRPYLDRVSEIVQERYEPRAIVFTETGLVPFADRAEYEAKMGQWAQQVDCAILGLCA